MQQNTIVSLNPGTYPVSLNGNKQVFVVPKQGGQDSGLTVNVGGTTPIPQLYFPDDQALSDLVFDTVTKNAAYAARDAARALSGGTMIVGFNQMMSGMNESANPTLNSVYETLRPLHGITAGIEAVRHTRDGHAILPYIIAAFFFLVAMLRVFTGTAPTPESESAS